VNHGADARQELLETGAIEVGVDLIRWLKRQGVDDVLSRTNEGRIVDVWLHRFWIE